MNPTNNLYSKIVAPIKDKLEAVEEEISKELASDIDVISRMSEHLALSKGKRLRPALFLLCSKMLGMENDKEITMATIFEFIHTATLIHDDIIDIALTRRGQATLNSIWGNELTVLLGDYLYLKATSMALSAENFEILHIFNDIALKLIEGEMIQLARRGDLTISEKDYLKIIQRKTAYLFSGCGKIPALLADKSDAEIQAITGYCFDLGIAFQIVDDILDFVGQEKLLGKPVANDLCEGTVTLPIIFALQHAKDDEVSMIRKIMEDDNISEKTQSSLLHVLTKYGAIEKTRAVAEQYASKAIKALDIFPDSNAKEFLFAIPPFVVDRSY